MIFFLKLLGKIAVVFKAAAFGDFLYAAVCVQKHLGSCLKPVAIQVLDFLSIVSKINGVTEKGAAAGVQTLV